MQLSFEISLYLTGKACLIHSNGPVVTTSKDAVLIKICCRHFQEEIREKIADDFGTEFLSTKVRFKLSAAPLPGISRRRGFDD